MKNFNLMSKEELCKTERELAARYEAFMKMGLHLNMARGLPCAAQLDMASPLLSCVTGKDGDYLSENGTDTRQYGKLEGLDEAARIFEYMCGAPRECTTVTGSASLNIMYDVLSCAMLFGVGEGYAPWTSQGKIKFICVVPGYDRHFSMCELLGIEMVSVGITPEGPDMDKVEELLRDPAVKGMWCVPKFANPTGYTYSEATVRRIAALSPAAEDFRIFWDNAYAVHDFSGYTELADILALTRGTKNENMIYMFASTSKITTPGSGISAFMSSAANTAWFRKMLGVRIISYDKINQLRHARFLPTKEALFSHMARHAEIVRPKFEAVLSVFEHELADSGIASWTKPSGGYFISLNVMSGTAKEVFRLCREAGVVLTNVGATFPYGKDPDDSNLRIAPTFPCVDELKLSAEVISVCAELAAVRLLLSK